MRSPSHLVPMLGLLQRLSRTETNQALDATVAISVVLGVIGVAWLLRRDEAPSDTPPAVHFRHLRHPWVAFLGVCALLLGNQVLVNVYVKIVHHGDPSFVSGYLGPGWFVLAQDAGPVEFLARHLPGWVIRDVLPLTVLRVQAFLELPFTLLAYLAVVALLDRGLCRRLVGSALLPLAAVSFTVTFCLIELRLWNPWTVSDLGWRWASCAAAIGAFALMKQKGLLRGDAGLLLQPRARLSTMLLFLAGAAAIAVLVLCMYDVTLLYNLGHFGPFLPMMGAALVVASGALVLLPPMEARGAPAPSLVAASALLAVFAAVFFVPSLAIRYCGARSSAQMAAGGLILFSLVAGCVQAARALRALSIPVSRVVPGCIAGLLSGAAALAGGLPWLRSMSRTGLFEAALLCGAILFLLAGLVTARLVDALVRPRPGPG